MTTFKEFLNEKTDKVLYPIEKSKHVKGAYVLDSMYSGDPLDASSVDLKSKTVQLAYYSEVQEGPDTRKMQAYYFTTEKHNNDQLFVDVNMVKKAIPSMKKGLDFTVL